MGGKKPIGTLPARGSLTKRPVNHGKPEGTEKSADEESFDRTYSLFSDLIPSDSWFAHSSDSHASVNSWGTLEASNSVPASTF